MPGRSFYLTNEAVLLTEMQLFCRSGTASTSRSVLLRNEMLYHSSCTPCTSTVVSLLEAEHNMIVHHPLHHLCRQLLSISLPCRDEVLLLRHFCKLVQRQCRIEDMARRNCSTAKVLWTVADVGLLYAQSPQLRNDTYSGFLQRWHPSAKIVAFHCAYDRIERSRVEAEVCEVVLHIDVDVLQSFGVLCDSLDHIENSGKTVTSVPCG